MVVDVAGARVVGVARRLPTAARLRATATAARFRAASALFASAARRSRSPVFARESPVLHAPTKEIPTISAMAYRAVRSLEERPVRSVDTDSV
jgi:hypothetical protein